MSLMFNILAILNNVGCVLTLTLLILFRRRPGNKNSPLEASKERARFKERWIIMAWWVAGTLMIAVFGLNILFIFPWVMIGAYSATFMSGYPDAESRERERFEPIQPTAGSSPKSPGGNEPPLEEAAVLPDLGRRLALMGAQQNSTTAYPSFTIKEIAVVESGRYCITRIEEIEGKLYCGTFDFGDAELDGILAQATEDVRIAVVENLAEDPRSVRNIPIANPIRVGIKAILGKPQRGIDETFIPLVITEIFPSL